MSIGNGAQFIGQHAVVIGGSIAGLTAARVLSEHFERVTLVERDQLTDVIAPRKGVPQGRHLHGFLKKGELLLESLFPDLIPALIEGGGVPVEQGIDFHWHHFGGWKVRKKSGVVSIFLSRPFLESEIRRRVLRLPNVRLCDGCDVLGLLSDAERKRVRGLILRRREGDAAEEELAADLVVDASGRGSAMPRWLGQLGRLRPEESTVRVRVAYATRQFRRPPPGTHPWKVLYILGQSPVSRRLGMLAPIEGDRWIAVLAGLLDDHPPLDEAGWMRFASELPAPDLHQALKGASPIDDIAGYNFPSHLRRHYERMPDFPDGLAVLGDAHCSFNPIYGQGISVATMGAVALGECLKEQRQQHGPGQLAGLSQRFQKSLARLTNDPWMMSTGEDFRYPEVQGTRPLLHPFMKWYTGHVHRATLVDPEVSLHFYRAMHMIAGFGALLRPEMIRRVLRSSAQSQALHPGSAPPVAAPTSMPSRRPPPESPSQEAV